MTVAQILLIIFIAIALVLVYLYVKEKRNSSSLDAELKKVKDSVSVLEKYKCCVDAASEAEQIRSSAKHDAESIIQEARNIAASDIENAKTFKQEAAKQLDDAQAEATKKIANANKEADSKIINATSEAHRLVEAAKKEASEIAGDAYKVKEEAEHYQEVAKAMKNLIDGYGTEYLKPSFSLLDELAEDFSFTDAGQKLKSARESSARMVRLGLAADSEYVEKNRRSTAIAFIVDAFNGKVDSILSKTKKDNYGTLERKIKDAYTLVNSNGVAFRNTSITPAYLSSRLNELKWACTVSELKARDQEEQRRIREQIREEEKARKEFERAQKEAKKEEEMLRKAMEKAEAMMRNASEEAKAGYEAKLEELRIKLAEAEAKGARALSMAQQTKRGNVYVISNIGAFGENVYKVGMTRRINPLDRVKELGDASVPFPFDVHAIIESEDAPALETQLHRELALSQLNKVNPRKEFFKVPLSSIKTLVEEKGIIVNWTLKAEAAEYYESLAIEKSIHEDSAERKRWEAFASNIAEEESDSALAAQEG